VTLEFSREHLRNQLAQNEADLETGDSPHPFRKRKRRNVGRARASNDDAATQRRGGA